MKRTPRSASRRASRQLAANEPSPGLQPYRSSTCCGSLVESIRSGTLACMLEGHFILSDARGDFRIVHQRIELTVERVDRPDDVLLPLARNAGRVAQIQHRVPFAAQVDSLKKAGQKAGGPLPGGDRLVLPAFAQRREHHEAGQVFRLAAQAIHDPGPHRRPARDLRARVHEHVGRIVIDGVGGHRADDADFVDHRTQICGTARRFRPAFAETS